MDFLGLNCSSPETDRIIDVSGGSVKQELQEQDLLRQLEESSDDSECTVDCTLSLGSSASSAKTPQRVDSKSDFWTKIDQKYCSSSQCVPEEELIIESQLEFGEEWKIPPGFAKYGGQVKPTDGGIEFASPEHSYCSISPASGVLGNHGFGNGGFSSFIWESGGSTYLPLRPELVNSSSRSEGYGFFGASSMAFSSVYTNYTRVDRTPMSKNLLRTAKDTPDFTSTRKCATCETTTTPLWRNGPKGTKSLCNACGIRFKKEERRARGYSNSGGQRNEQSLSKKPKI